VNEGLAISAEGLGKCYRLSADGASVAGAISRVMRGEWRRRPLRWVLREVSFNVGRGEVVGLVGHNGAGKSTLLKILARVTAPNAGSCRIRGRVGSLLEVGTGFHPDLSGRENITLSGVILGLDRRTVAARSAAIAAFADIGDYLDQPVRSYSSGMFVRLAFAVAAHLDPDVLLVDEALEVGDQVFQERAAARIRALVAEDRSVLVVSHHLVSLRQLCDRVVWLEAGRVRQAGPAAAVIDAYVASCAGADPIALA
jgi:ABC-type polysaccharide/polyol phosphate transport system ATPase subunit